MSLLKQVSRSMAAIALIGSTLVFNHEALVTPVNAQEFTPFVDPLEFDPDWQWFAPIDVQSLAELSPKKRANYGFFATHDRTRSWISRPDNGVVGGQFANDNTGDFTWGHRTDIGFVRENGSGWLINFRRLTTDCGIYDSVLTPRINRYNPDDDGETEVFPFEDRNDSYYGARYYNVSDSLNVAYYNDFEINKTWRRSPYRYGGILEPFVGFRYSNFRDVAQDQEYEIDLLDPTLERLVTDRTVTWNRMIGGQAGARYFTHYHRWRLSLDGRAFLAGNFQANDNVFTTDSTQYDGVGTGAGVVSTFINSSFIHRTDTSLVWGYEIRADAAYQLTKYIGIRGGLEFIELVQGIWRGGTSLRGNTDDRNQDVFMAGITFGIELNR